MTEPTSSFVHALTGADYRDNADPATPASQFAVDYHCSCHYIATSGVHDTAEEAISASARVFQDHVRERQGETDPTTDTDPSDTTGEEVESAN